MSKTRSTNGPDQDNDTIDLTSILSRQVEPRDEVHFTPIIEETSDEPFIEPEPERVEEIREEPAAEPGSHDRLSYADIGAMIVDGFDGVQSFLFALGSRYMKLSAEERALLPNLDTSGKMIYEEGSKEAKAMAAFRKHLETLKKIPFTDQERKRLITASTIYAKTIDLKLTPLQGLMMAYGGVLITRGYDVFGDLI